MRLKAGSPKVLVLLLLLLIPGLACFLVELSSPTDAVQGYGQISLKITNEAETLAQLDTVELRFPNPLNITSYGGGSCAEPVGDNACKVIIWKLKDISLIEDQEFTLSPSVSYCIETVNKTTLDIDVITTGTCPVKMYEYQTYQDSFTATRSFQCGSFHPYPGNLENVSIYAYYRPLDEGNSYLQLYSIAYEDIAVLNKTCDPYPCGTFLWFNKTDTTTAMGLQVCANATYGEVIIGEGHTSVNAWWSYWNYTKTVEQNQFSIKVKGRPVIRDIVYDPNTIKELDSVLIKAAVEMQCGWGDDVEVNATSNNITIIDITSPTPQNYHFDTNELRWVEWSSLTDEWGTTNFTVTAKYGDFEDEMLSLDLEVEKNPIKCNKTYYRCNNICQLAPNCTQPCALGMYCLNGRPQCRLRTCGVPCPNQPDKTCSALGYCLEKQKNGWPCDCKEMCSSAYLDGETCYYNPTCGLTCQYEYKFCLTGTCQASGCCGDGLCDLAENCAVCPQDCLCDDNDPCTVDACEFAKCTHKNAPCGIPCNDGICNGWGACKKDACCDDTYCNDHNECTRDTCADFACTFSPLQCTNCTDGYCSSGNCAQLKVPGDRCECENSCQYGVLCKQGYCSSCGNGACEPGECLSCFGDCAVDICFNRLIVQNTSQLVIGLVLLTFIAWFAKSQLPAIQKEMQKFRPPPPSNEY